MNNNKKQTLNKKKKQTSNRQTSNRHIRTKNVRHENIMCIGRVVISFVSAVDSACSNAQLKIKIANNIPSDMQMQYIVK